MNFTLTARHFKAHDSLKEFAEAEIEKVTRFYDGIIKCEVILSYENPTNSVKNAEVILKINNHHTFAAKEKSNDFKVSIENAVDKISSQLKKYKDKLKPNHSEKPIIKEEEE